MFLDHTFDISIVDLIENGDYCILFEGLINKSKY